MRAFRIKDGLVYAVEFSHRSGRDLLNVAKKRTNIVPIIEDARHPHKYRMLVGELALLNIMHDYICFHMYWNILGMVDCIFSDVAQPDQARIVALNAHNFLRNEGFVVISIKVIFIFITLIRPWNLGFEIIIMIVDF